MRAVVVVALSVTIGFGFLPGCEKKAARKKPAAAQGTQPVAEEKFVQPQISEEPAFVYMEEGKRDPFLSLIVPTGKAEKKVDITQVMPLQVYEAGDHKLIGIVDQGERGMIAMLVRPDGKGFTVQLGTPVGTRGGRVSGIDMDGVHIEETVPDYRGNPTLQTVTLELRKEAQ